MATKAAPLGLRFPAAGQPVPSYSLQDDFGRTLGLTGCDELPFDPSFSFAPGVPQASTATGFRMDLRVPQEVSENAGGRVTSAVKDVNIVFPEGVVVNPADANGLAACSEGLVGFTGFGELNPAGEHGTQTALFTPRLPGSVPALEAGETEPLRPGVNFCSTAAKIANVKIVSPLVLKDPLEGAVYLAAQNENPFGSLIAAYLVAEDEQAGVLVKAAGEVQLSASGQISTTFKNNPAVPFEDLEVNFLDGERAALATPARCETYTTTATLTPWSGNPPATIHSKFKLTSGPGGGPCPGPGATLPLTPSFTAGTTSINAGGFTPLTTTIARPDGNQQLQSVQVTMPPGVSGILTGVPLCPEAAANEGACPAGSLIGETTITAGVGGQPVTIKGGKVYLTERYAGAPFGLAIVNPVKAGPFDLEHDTNNPAQHPACDCLVIRAKVQIDPTTAQLTVTTDPSGPHAIPSVIDGVPAQIKTANVTITRPAFTINPTDCNPMSIQTTITGAEGTTTPTITTPFQIANCANLKFEPKIHVFTGAHPTKANGTNLIFKISYPKNPLGQQAWFQSAKFNIPKQLPARLTTIQKACPAQTFETNPAACPAGSRIGQATVHTPALPVPLNGPVYFVSHGGAKFPDVVMVLQGYGITIQLRGETLIRKGVTSAIFRNTPDVPFQSIEVNIPQGPHSEFTANLPPKAKNNMCGQKLTIPTLIKAQNNQQLKQNTPITITNCNKPNTKPKKK